MSARRAVAAAVEGRRATPGQVVIERGSRWARRTYGTAFERGGVLRWVNGRRRVGVRVSTMDKQTTQSHNVYAALQKTAITY